jgi:hypothetical protein
MDSFRQNRLSERCREELAQRLAVLRSFKKGIGLASQLQQDTIAIKSFTGSAESAKTLSFRK